MKKFVFIIAMAFAAVSCAVKDENIPLPNPDYNNFFQTVWSDFHSTSTTIWVESVRYYAPGAVVTRYGICCALFRLPTITDNAVSASEGAPLSDVMTLTGLSPNTTYTCRAFFVTSDGTAYYSESFEVATASTLSLELDGFPTSNTKDGGYVKAVLKEGSFGDCTERGFCYGTSEVPTVNDYKVAIAGTSSTMQGYIPMSPGQMFYYRAYVRLQDGSVIYSDESNYIQTYAVTEGFSVSNLAYGVTYNSTYYPFSAQLDATFSYYSTSQTSEIGFKEGSKSWKWNNITDGKITDYRTWYFEDVVQTMTYQAYAVLKSTGKRVWGEEKTAYFYYN